MITKKFKYGSQNVDMHLGYKLAMYDLSELGLNVLTITQPGNTVMQTIMVDDQTVIKIWFFYLVQAGIVEKDAFDEALDVLDQQEGGLEPFRKAFWDLVVGFSPQTIQKALQDQWKESLKALQESTHQKTTTTSSSSSLQEQD